MKLIKPGQTVVLTEGRPGEASSRVEAVITRISISINYGVLYECSWWNDRCHYEKWFYAAQIHEPQDAEYLTIEFATP